MAANPPKPKSDKKGKPKKKRVDTNPVGVVYPDRLYTLTELGKAIGKQRQTLAAWFKDLPEGESPVRYLGRSPMVKGSDFLEFFNRKATLKKSSVTES